MSDQPASIVASAAEVAAGEIEMEEDDDYHFQTRQINVLVTDRKSFFYTQVESRLPILFFWSLFL